jgi:DNA repair protein RadC
LPGGANQLGLSSQPVTPALPLTTLHPSIVAIAVPVIAALATGLSPTGPQASSRMKGAVMLTTSVLPAAHARGHRVRELVCAYRPLRDGDGRVVAVPTLHLSNPQTAAATLAPLLMDQPVEVFAVACLSTKNRLLAWHVLSRGTRSSTPVSMPDVFVPACLTPGTTGVMVVHNHPSGDPTPSPDDARLTLRLCAAADILDIPLLDHLIVGDAQRYFSFREAGALRAAT